MRGSFLSTLMPMRSSSASTLERPAWSDTSTLAAIADRFGRDMLVGRRILQDRRGMNAGLGGKRACRRHRARDGSGARLSMSSSLRDACGQRLATARPRH